MQFFLAFTLTISAIFSLFSGAASLNSLVERTSSDLCGEVKSELKVPHPSSPNKYIVAGRIEACMCVSDLPQFMATDPVAISAVALVGKSTVTTHLTNMIKDCGPEQCYYPPHSVPVCSEGHPCGFTCSDGYTPYPYNKPNQCICEKPYYECNGKCGDYRSCPSAYAKRDAHFGNGKLCPQGLTACGILGRNSRTWECIDTQHELESCGGCSIPLSLSSPEGEDCTIIPGVSDVSCVKGRCAVHRCMPGYDIDLTGSSCLYSEDKDPILLAAQYGLDYIHL